MRADRLTLLAVVFLGAAAGVLAVAEQQRRAHEWQLLTSLNAATREADALRAAGDDA